jgi:hypothetical protein
MVLVISLQGSPPAERRYLTALRGTLPSPPDPSKCHAISWRWMPPSWVSPRGPSCSGSPPASCAWCRCGETRACSGSNRHSAAPRTWELARVELVRDWDSDGRLEALAPSAEGARVLPLAAGDGIQELPLPLVADYGSPTLENYFRPGFLAGIVSWPTFELADDDGDGRPDLFAADRYQLRVFRTTAAGLPQGPSRVHTFHPSRGKRSAATSRARCSPSCAISARRAGRPGGAPDGR